MSSLYKKMAKGAAWMVLLKLLERLIGLGSIVVLARLLIPADFGLVALATAVIAVLELMGAFSFDLALIQRPNAERSYYDTAWTFNVTVGVVAAICLALLAHPLASFYNDARLENVMRALAFAPLLGGLENIGIIVFRKEMHFHKEFGFLLTKKLTSVLVTLVIALTWKNYWALVIGILTGRFVGTALSYIVNDYRPRLSLARRRELTNFSAWLFVHNISSFVSGRTADFIIGKAAGPAALGVYSIAYEVSNLPTTELVAPINRAVFPAYAKMGHSIKDLQIGYLRVAGMIAVLTLPAALGITALAKTFIPLVFGEKWTEAVPLVQILAFYGLTQATQNNIGSVYIALGKPKYVTYFSLSFNAVMVPLLLYMSLRFGSIGAAVALLGSALLIAPANFRLVFKLLDMRFVNFAGVVWRPLVAGLAMLGVVLALQHTAYAMAVPRLAILIGLVLSGAVVYIAGLLLLWHVSGRPEGAELTMVNMVKERLAKIALQKKQHDEVDDGR